MSDILTPGTSLTQPKTTDLRKFIENLVADSISVSETDPIEYKAVIDYGMKKANDMSVEDLFTDLSEFECQLISFSDGFQTARKLTTKK